VGLQTNLVEAKTLVFVADVFAVFAGLSYFGIFLLLFLVNVAPVLMPPTWLI
jgi:hypothetical protein